MKRFLAMILAAVMILTVAACGKTETPETPETPDNGDVAVSAPAENSGELKPGVYKATSSYATEGMNMTWNFVLTLKDDSTFTLTDEEGTDKGTGTYTLTDNCYTLVYADERTGTFVTTADGTLKCTTDFPYGKATIQLALVGDIEFYYYSTLPVDEDLLAEAEQEIIVGGNFGIIEGDYAASYTKESAMAGTVVYNYSATINADGTFSYSVKFDMGGTTMDGAAATGTYVFDGSKFTFTDSEGNVTEGAVTAENTIVIALKASAMAADPYEVTFVPAAAASLAAGNYAASYTKESAMAGTVVYDYSATVGADGTFSYSVKFDMGGTAMDGVSAAGTYVLNGSSFVFTDSEGNVTEGTVTADNTLVISLKASAMAADPYEVTFTVAE